MSNTNDTTDTDALTDADLARMRGEIAALDMDEFDGDALDNLRDEQIPLLFETFVVEGTSDESSDVTANARVAPESFAAIRESALLGDPDAQQEMYRRLESSDPERHDVDGMSGAMRANARLGTSGGVDHEAAARLSGSQEAPATSTLAKNGRTGRNGEGSDDENEDVTANAGIEAGADAATRLTGDRERIHPAPADGPYHETGDAVPSGSPSHSGAVGHAINAEAEADRTLRTNASGFSSRVSESAARAHRDAADRLAGDGDGD